MRESSDGLLKEASEKELYHEDIGSFSAGDFEHPFTFQGWRSYEAKVKKKRVPEKDYWLRVKGDGKEEVLFMANMKGSGYKMARYKQTPIMHSRKTNIIANVYRGYSNLVNKYEKKGEPLPSCGDYAVQFCQNHVTQETKHITGVDIKHAYWRQAYNIGLIGLKTYKNGLNGNIKDVKVIRNKALASKTANWIFERHVNGVATGEQVTFRANPDYVHIYHYIINSVAKLMHECMGIAGDKAIGYLTDCIYFHHDPILLKKIKGYIESKSFDCRVLKNYCGTDLPRQFRK